MCRVESNENKEQIPFILRPWISLYRATPKIYIPGTDVDISFSLLFAVIFSVLRISFRHALYWFGWPVGAPDTYFASACMGSFCHSSLILPGLAAILLSQKYIPSGKLEPSPKWYQDATHSLMGFCTGYMIYDSIMGYVVERWQPGIGPVLLGDDLTYIAHHMLTTLYMASARLNKAGHMSAMMLMFNGEFSAPFMNVHLFVEKALAQECCKGIAWLPTLFAYNEQFFAFVYIVCRVAVSPFTIGYVTYDLLLTKRGRRDVPLWLSISWMPMCWGIQFGSIPWIYTCIETLKQGTGGGEHGEL
mmetsp:Transcript_22587/g.40415  ORF Transcript_22587/g.40415 Transcript_22587/m.40415 type:complete len:303 (+) Transcript_22587:136-1044(+)|eukprot:CAMPEP_0201888124 /NCGR_PEP_ID=MMETSP0902-20130614/26728_1 /ASSEMBLY_ACC=CAM_ASM_000551 /TAXON_ID=420261 /ORGANISM="Thalassiosira antarctica, Strain CCMP982" /LENGTH=302 /DNA_ID=CAMNT_0048418279 /DNA_START=117 /DNA_END=1025 /DNA_ORIENTATION=-